MSLQRLLRLQQALNFTAKACIVSMFETSRVYTTLYILKLTPRDDLFCALDRFELEYGQLNHKYYHHVNIILFYKTLQLLSAMIVSLCLYNCISTCFVSLLAFFHFFGIVVSVGMSYVYICICNIH